MRAILVCGIGASGTSAVAGALHHMGVPMGHDAHLGRHPAGFSLYEDAEFYGAFQRGDHSEIKRLVLRHAREPVFGFKNTLAFKCLSWLPDFLNAIQWDTRIVACHRAAMASAKGRQEGRCPPGVFYSRAEAQRWAMQALNEYTDALLSLPFETPVHHVQYEWLIDDPEGQVGELAAFAFQGLDAEPDLDAGIAHITSRGP